MSDNRHNNADYNGASSHSKAKAIDNNSNSNSRKAIVYIFIIQKLRQLTLYSGEFARKLPPTQQPLHGDVVLNHRSCFLCT